MPCFLSGHVFSTVSDYEWSLMPTSQGTAHTLPLQDLSNNLLSGALPATWSALLPASLNRHGMSLFNNSLSGETGCCV